MHRSNLLVKYFAAFTLFLIIPLLIAGYLFNYNVNGYSEEEIGKFGVGKLKIIKSINDLLSDALSKDAMRLSLNTSIKDLEDLDSYGNILKNGRETQTIANAISALTELTRTSDMLHSVYIYLDDADYIITTNGSAVLKSEFYDTGWLKAYEEYKKSGKAISWLSARLPADSRFFAKGAPVLPASNLDSYVITYISPLTPYTTNIKGAIVINIFEASISKLLNNNEFNSEGLVSIITPDGDVVSHVDKSLLGKNISDRDYIKGILKSSKDSGYTTAVLNSRKKLITYYKSGFNNWIYVGEFPLDTLNDKVNKLRLNIVYILVGLSLIGLVASYIISRKLYNPLRKLVQDIKERKGIDFKDSGNEFILLSRAFENISKREESLFNMVEKSKHTIRNNYILELLDGNTNSEIDAAEVNFDFPMEYFICAVLVIDGYKEFDALYQDEQQYYRKELIRTVCEQALNSSFKCAGVIYDSSHIALIININGEHSSSIYRQMKKSFISVQEELSKVLDNTVSVGIGFYYSGRNGIKRSFSEAQEALKYRVIYGYKSIISWIDVNHGDNKYFYPYTAEKHILNCLSLGSEDDIKSSIKALIDEIINRDGLSCDNILQIFNQLAGNLIKHLVDSNINISDVYGNNYSIYRELSQKETVKEIEAWLIAVCMGIIEYRDKQKDENQGYLTEIMDFISKNYKRDIDINMLAEHVGLSYSYVRKVFKNKTGKNLVDYINSLRIEEAKRLLQQTDMPVIEIALNLGYNNDQSFNRFFKKYEGVTPGEFRNTVRESR